MKIKEKKALLNFLENNQVRDAIAYINDCTRDSNGSATAQERNLRWAMNNSTALDILDMAIGGSRIVMNTTIERKTLSCVISYVYKDRKYKLLKVSNEAYLVARVK